MAGGTVEEDAPAGTAIRWMRLHARQDGSTQTFRTSRSHPSSALSCVMPLRARCRFQTDELEHSDILGPLEYQARDLRKLRSAPEPALVLRPAAGLRPRKALLSGEMGRRSHGCCCGRRPWWCREM